jgi:hypothetical protein
MSVQLDCFDYIIGLSRTECDCFGTLAEAYTYSESGLYMEDLVELAGIEGLLNCQTGSDIWAYMDKARTQAITSFRSQASALLMKRNQLKRKPFYGSIALQENDGEHTGLTVGDYYGLSIDCNQIKGGYLTIKKIGAYFADTGAVAVTVIDNMGTNYGTFNLTTTADTFVLNNVTDLELPLYSEFTDNLTYYIYYQLGANNPYKNYITSTGGVECCYNDQIQNYKWSDFVTAKGFHSDDLTDLQDCCTGTSNYAYGLTLQVELKCKVNEIFCDYIDFDGEPLAGTIAEAINIKAAMIFIDRFSTSVELNRSNLLNREAWKELKAEWKVQYENFLGYIVENIDINKNDCLVCHHILNPTLRTILA